MGLLARLDLADVRRQRSTKGSTPLIVASCALQLVRVGLWPVGPKATKTEGAEGSGVRATTE